MDAVNGIEVHLDGETLIEIAPGQKYVRTLPFLGFLTCVRCGAIVDQQLTGAHDAMHDGR